MNTDARRQLGMAVNFFACYGVKVSAEGTEMFLNTVLEFVEGMLKPLESQQGFISNKFLGVCGDLYRFCISQCDDTVSQSSRDDIHKRWSDLAVFLQRKNQSYGSSVFEPLRVFSSADAHEQLLARMDDKLSRIVRGNCTEDSIEDTVKDFLGYVVLLKMHGEGNGN